MIVVVIVEVVAVVELLAEIKVLLNGEEVPEVVLEVVVKDKMVVLEVVIKQKVIVIAILVILIIAMKIIC